MQALTVSIVQADLHWHDAQKSREYFANVLHALNDQTDLIVLPEMFTTGFTMDAKPYAESMDGVSVSWMKEMAAEKNTSVCGSLIIAENDKFYNRFICVDPNGQEASYDKRHLFRLADEQHHFSAGDEIISFEINGWRICPMVCYDLRFPVWSRNRNNYDLLLYVANWPSRRHYAWESLLRARAIENLSYVVGVNRTGVDGNDIPYTGGSAIIDYTGQELANLNDQTGVVSKTLDIDALEKFRNRFAFHEDADDFSIVV
ncbi:MAG: amidohydrolase [Gammaproteobacteria bacterium]|nr:MAG: amidohydrolase [Gammaproteobacteria bacterium]